MPPPRAITIDQYVVTPTATGTSGATLIVDAKSTTTSKAGRRSFFQTLQADAYVTVKPGARFVLGEGTTARPGTRAIEDYLRALRQPRCVREALVTACDGLPKAIEAYMRDYGPPGFRAKDHHVATPQQWFAHLTPLAKAMQGKLNVAGIEARMRGEIARALEGQIALLKGRVEGNRPATPPEMWRIGRLAELAERWIARTPNGKPDPHLRESIDTLAKLSRRVDVRGID
ncbi:MAG: hypothetical protein HY543_07880 [Deltaproteobacteria bacterium]|nr:hypothetical protein [Deltaproteobacteria bacterium]